MDSLINCFINQLFLYSQSDRADNVLSGTKWEMVTKIREDIKDFKLKKNLDKVIIMCIPLLYLYISFINIGHYLVDS